MLLRMGTAPAWSDRPNEDFVAATAHAVVLLDGAGAPAGTVNGCVHGTAWYVRTLAAHLLTGMTPDRSLADTLADAITRVHYLHTGTCDLSHPATPSATVLVVRREGERLDHLVLSDSVLVLDRADDEPLAITDDRQPAVARRLRKAMDALPTGSPEHTRALREFLESLAAYRNQPGGFWTAAAKPEAAGEALVGSVPAAELDAVALLSDGASRLVDRFHLATWPQLLDILAEDGPDELIRLTRTAEDGDPVGRRWPRGKTYDDCTAAHWTLHPRLGP